MWQSGSALDQSIVGMNRSVMQLLTAQTGSQCAIVATNTVKSGCANGSYRCSQIPG